MVGRIVSMIVGVVVGTIYRDDILRALRVSPKRSKDAPEYGPPPLRLPEWARDPLVEPSLDKPFAKPREDVPFGIDRTILVAETPMMGADARFHRLYGYQRKLLRELPLLSAAVGRYARSRPSGDRWAEYFEARFSISAQAVYDQMTEEVLHSEAVLRAVDEIGKISEKLTTVSKEFSKMTETWREIDAALGFVESLLGWFVPKG